MGKSDIKALFTEQFWLVFTGLFFYCFLPIQVYGLGLGEIEVKSALNEPFDVQIELISVEGEDISELTIGIATQQDFRRLGVPWSVVLNQLNFSMSPSGKYIKIFSKEPIREPFLNFLLEIDWLHGHLFREYTVLLDPPLYNANTRIIRESRGVIDKSDESTFDDASDEHDGHRRQRFQGAQDVVYESEFEEFFEKTRKQSGQNVHSDFLTEGDYWIKSGDTLWEIASPIAANTSLDINQVMIAIFRANPEVFFNYNINLMKAGVILNLPDTDAISSISLADATVEARQHHARWRQDNSLLDVDTTQFSSQFSSDPPSSDLQNIDAELKLLAVESDHQTNLGSDAQFSSDSQPAQEVATGVAQLILAEESLSAVTQENILLKDRLQQSETIISDQQRLIEIQNNELTQLKNILKESALITEEFEESLEAEQKQLDNDSEIPEQGILIEGGEQEQIFDEAIGVSELEGIVESEEEIPGGGTLTQNNITDSGGASLLESTEGKPESPAIDKGSGDALSTGAQIDEGKPTITGVLIKHLSDLWTTLKSYILYIIGIFIALAAVVSGVRRYSERKAEKEYKLAARDSELDDIASSTEVDVGLQTTEFSTKDDIAVAEIDPNEITDSYKRASSKMIDLDAEDVEEEPLMEVNNYLAYEQYEQAEQFVREALKKEPNNLGYHTRLLEVFYTSGNKKAFEEAAKVLHEKVNGEGSNHWELAALMWSEMSPNRGLFEQAQADEPDMVESGGIVDLTSPVEGGSPSTQILDVTTAESEDVGVEIDLEKAISDGGENVAAFDIAPQESQQFDELESIERPLSNHSINYEPSGSSSESGEIDASELTIDNLSSKEDIGVMADSSLESGVFAGGSMGINEPTTDENSTSESANSDSDSEEGLDATVLLSELDDEDFDTTFDLPKPAMEYVSFNSGNEETSSGNEETGSVIVDAISNTDGLDFSDENSTSESANSDSDSEEGFDATVLLSELDDEDFDTTFDLPKPATDSDDVAIPGSTQGDTNLLDMDSTLKINASNVDRHSDGLESDFDMPDFDVNQQDNDISDETLEMAKPDIPLEDQGADLNMEPKLDIDMADDTSQKEDPPSEEEGNREDMMSFSLDDPLPDPQQPDTQESPDSGTLNFNSKLNLVTAYIELDDKDSAISSLDEIVKSGSEEQLKKAKDSAISSLDIIIQSGSEEQIKKAKELKELLP